MSRGLSAEKKRMYKSNIDFYKDYEGIQQSFLIGLLNSHYSFKILSPTKPSTVTVNTFRIKVISDGADDIDIYKFAQDQCQYLFDMNMKRNPKVKTAIKLNQKNRRIFALNYLVDVAREDGYFFNTESPRKFTFSVSLDRIVHVFKDNKLMFDHNSIIMKGTAINRYIFDRLRNEHNVTIEKGDATIADLLSM